MASHSESSPGHQSPVGHPGSARILVAEDPFLGTFLRTVLQKHGHRVITGAADRACDLLREGRLSADIIVTNEPAAFLEFAQQIPVLYLASSPDDRLAARFSHCLMLRKPFHNEELLAAVEQLACSVVP